MAQAAKTDWVDWMDRLDRRFIYGAMILVLLASTFMPHALPPAQLPTARKAFDAIEQIPADDRQIVFVAFDWDGSTKAENQPQSEALLEHLMRRRIKFALISSMPTAEPFLINLPLEVGKKLAKERPGEQWEYGKDWVDLGYRPSLGILLQQIPKTEDLRDVFATDSNGVALRDIPCMKRISRFDQIPLLIQATGSVGALEMWLAFFQSEVHRPEVIHGCTSISIPRNFIFLDSGQVKGLLEGVAGAAYYQQLLGYRTDQPTPAMKNMSGVSLGQICIVILIILGNLGMFLKSRARRRALAQGGRP